VKASGSDDSGIAPGCLWAFAELGLAWRRAAAVVYPGDDIESQLEQFWMSDSIVKIQEVSTTVW